MTTARGRRIQGRRALAIMAWASLVIVAGLLWYGQHNRIIRIQSWEPAALLLSAYATFLAIFGWLLFSPGRKSAEESPGLFFAGMLTLLPPCFIAYHLMPVGSPLKPWMTIGVFVFGIIAIMSPLPDEVFAVPRDRRNYLQPLTDAYLSELNVDEPQIRFENVAPRTQYWLTRPQQEPDSPDSTTARDPWSDPFYGTGRQMSRIGVSQSRRTDESTRSDRRRQGEEHELPVPFPSSSLLPGNDLTNQNVRASFSNLTPVNQSPRTVSQSIRTETDRPLPLREQTPELPSSASDYRTSIPPAGQSRPLEPHGPKDLRSTDVRAQSFGLPGSAQNPAAGVPSTAARRPLTEPSGRTATTAGFQMPPQPSVKPEQRGPSLTPPPVPTTGYPAKNAPPVSFPTVSLPPVSLPPIPAPVIPTPPVITPAVITPPASFSSASVPLTSETSRSSAAVPPPARPLTDIAMGASAAALASQLSSVAPESVTERSSLQSPDVARLMSSAAPSVSKSAESRLKELDRQVREQELREADEDRYNNDYESLPDVGPLQPAPGMSRSSQQPSNDVTLERIRDEHGGEMIEGTIKVFFEVGQKRAHLHVPFSPPLAGLPEVECEPVGDDPIRLKVAVRQPYGVRIEARRAEAAEALRTEVSFAAVYTPSTRRS